MAVVMVMRVWGKGGGYGCGDGDEGCTLTSDVGFDCCQCMCMCLTIQHLAHSMGCIPPLHSTHLHPYKPPRYTKTSPTHNNPTQTNPTHTGVLHTHRSVMSQVNTLVNAWAWHPDDRMLHALPLHHVHGIVNGLYCPLAVGATVECLPKFSPGAVWGALMVGWVRPWWGGCAHGGVGALMGRVATAWLLGCSHWGCWGCCCWVWGLGYWDVLWGMCAMHAWNVYVFSTHHAHTQYVPTPQPYTTHTAPQPPHHCVYGCTHHVCLPAGALCITHE